MRISVAGILLFACAVSGKLIQPNTDGITRQFQSQDGFGQAKYGYSHSGQSAETHRDARGNQVGSYAYINPEGIEIRVNFIADENGYRVDNDHTQETAEVAAARSSHLAAHAAALAAAKAASPNQEEWDNPQPIRSKVVTIQKENRWAAPHQTWSEPQTSKWTSVQADHGLSQPVQDTPEVQAAKNQFYQSYREAAARTPNKEGVNIRQQNYWEAPQQQTRVVPQYDSWLASQPVQPLSSDTARQFQSQDGFGQAEYGYSHPGQSAQTRRDAQGNQVGSYAYINPERKEIRVNFVADENGYRVDNDHTQETPEVAAARSAHLAAHAAALEAARTAQQNEEVWGASQAVKSRPVAMPQQTRWTSLIDEYSP